jgi:predicted acyl esterase
VTGRYQVILGPWGHGAGLDPTIELEWHDTWLKGQDTGIAETDTPMHLFALGSKKWLNASVFPLTQQYTALHLGDGTLSKAAPKQSGSATLQWADPTTSGATLTFDADPVTSEQLLAGPISATIYAKSSTKNLNLIPTLYDVPTTGDPVAIATGSLVGSLRAINQKTSWYDANGVMVRPDHPYLTDKITAPNALQRYDIFVNPAVYSLLPGHHLRLVLSTQPPSTECQSLLSALGIVLPCLPTTPQKEALTGGVFTIVWSKTSPSAINVPLMPANALPEATSAVTPTSRNLVEPIQWDSPRPRVS